MASHTFFGFQILVRPSDAGFHTAVRTAINQGASSAELPLAAKRVQYTHLANLLAGEMPRAERGYWDLITSDRAETEYESWCSEIEKVVQEPSAGPSPYCIVSVAVLALAGSNSDTTLRERCDLGEAQFFTRDTFLHLVHTLPMLNFASVAADSIYLVPGEAGAGPTEEELADEGYEYLRRLL
jgi:hypothetical protein